MPESNTKYFCTVAESTNARTHILHGALLSCLMSISTVLSAVILPNSYVLGLLSVVFIPFVIAFIIIRNARDALLLVCLNEIYFGASGIWIKIGPIPGRGLLLLSVLLLCLISRNESHQSKQVSGIRSSYILFYGLLFPAILLLYSITIKGVSVINAFSDTMRFGTLLIYFPLRIFVRRNFYLLLAWLTCASTILALLFITMAIAPLYIRELLFVNWMRSGDSTIFDQYLLEETTRSVTPSIVLCFLGFFIGAFYATDNNSIFALKWLGILVLLISISASIVNYLRGTIIATGITLLFMFTISLTSGINRIRYAKIIICALCVAIIGYWYSINYISRSKDKWDMYDKPFDVIVGTPRIEQTAVMLDTWLEEPIMGKGVGSPIKNYSRTDEYEGLAFEVQYPMILYRIGIVGFILLALPFVITIYSFIRKLTNTVIIQYDIGKLQLAVICSIVTLLLSSWSNPYLASVFTPYYLVLYYSLDDNCVNIH